jgi:hypothetical protein
MVANRFRQFLLSLLLFMFSVILHAQDLTQKISIRVKNESLEHVLQKISGLSNLHFSYSSQRIPVSQAVSLRIKNKPVKEILDKLCSENNIKYELVENQLVLTQNEESKTTVSAEKYTISGYIRDKQTGEVLIGASIYISEQPLGTTTNSYGFFSLSLHEGLYQINISYLGYKNMVFDTLLNKNMQTTLSMEPATIEMPLVEVTGKDSSLLENQKLFNKITEKEISQSVGITGNADAIKSLQFLPGINSMGDGSSFFYVRGGNSFQNLILMDDAPIYNPSHLFGFFTSVVPGAIKDMTLYKGDFPSNYGGRLASVIDIRTKDGNLYNPSFSGNINPFVSDISFESPLIKGKSSIFVSARKSNVDWVNWFRTESYKYQILFFDLNVKLNFKLNDYNRLFYTVYGGYDDFSRMITSKIRNFGISWNNILSTLRWNHVFNQKLFSNTTAYISRYNYYLYFSSNPDDYWNSSVLKKTAKTDFTYFANPRLTLKSGIEAGMLYSNPGNINLSGNSSSNSLPQISKYDADNLTFYISSEQHITSRLLFDYGIRATYWQDIGPTNVYVYNAYYTVIDTIRISNKSVYSKYVVLEPSIKGTCVINKNNLVKATYNRSYQMENIISNSVSPFNSTEVLIPADPNVLPQKADLFSAGYSHLFEKLGLLLEDNVFYQHYEEQIDYKDHANLLFNPLLEGELRFGSTQAYGNELLLKKIRGKITGWLAYTYSHVFRKTDGINNNDIYPAIYDRPQNITVNLLWALNKRWTVSANWQYVSGSVTTVPIGFYYYNGYSVPIYTHKNNSRLPDYHRLDLSCSLQLNKRPHRYSHSLALSVYNVYRRKNPISINFNKIEDSHGNYVVPANFYNDNSLLTTIISVAGIVPSVTYKFNFR